MKKVILIIVIVLLAGIGGYFLLRGGYQYPAPVSAPTPAPGVAPETVEEKIVSEGTSEITEPEVGETPEIKEFTISGTEYSFSPALIKVKTGEQVKIIFRNTGRIVHNFVVEELGIGTRTISPGQTDTIEFTIPASGTYTFICSVPGHAIAGMLGDLIVE